MAKIRREIRNLCSDTKYIKIGYILHINKKGKEYKRLSAIDTFNKTYLPISSWEAEIIKTRLTSNK